MTGCVHGGLWPNPVTQSFHSHAPFLLVTPPIALTAAMSGNASPPIEADREQESDQDRAEDAYMGLARGLAACARAARVLAYRVRCAPSYRAWKQAVDSSAAKDTKDAYKAATAAFMLRHDIRAARIRLITRDSATCDRRGVGSSMLCWMIDNELAASITFVLSRDPLPGEDKRGQTFPEKIRGRRPHKKAAKKTRKQKDFLCCAELHGGAQGQCFTLGPLGCAPPWACECL